MAYREIGMWEILEVLRRVHRGKRQRAIARVTGHSRTTVRRWVAVACKLGWVPVLAVPDEALAVCVAERTRPVRRDAPPGESEALLAPHRAQIAAWLQPDGGGRGLRLTKVYELLRRQAVAVPYSSLHRFATQACGFQDARRLTVRVADCAPGELAELDFGRLGLVPDAASGRRRVLHALIVTLAVQPLRAPQGAAQARQGRPADRVRPHAPDASGGGEVHYRLRGLRARARRAGPAPAGAREPPRALRHRPCPFPRP
jgi:hypothetical protein